MLNMIIVLIAWEAISVVYFSLLYKTDYCQYTFQDIISYFLGAIRWVLPTGHFWFIIALISVYIIFPILKMAYDTEEGKKILLCIVGFIILLRFIPNEANYIQQYVVQNVNSDYVFIEFSKLYEYLPFGNYSFALVYFIMGGILHDRFYVKRNQHKTNKIISVLMMLIGWVYVYIMKGITTGFGGGEFTNLGNGYACIGTLLLSIGLFTLFVDYQGDENRLVTLISDNSLGIYYVHCLYLEAISLYIYPLISSRGVIVNLLKAVIVLALSTLTSLILKKIPLLKKIV